MIGAVEDMEEPQLDEAQRRLKPLGSSRTIPGSPRNSNARARPHRREEQQCRDHPQAQPLKPRMDGELGTIRTDRVFQQHVEKLLVPVQLHVVRSRNPVTWARAES